MVSDQVDLNRAAVFPWMEEALCAQVASDVFFPEKGGSTREAKRICASCDVAAECLAFALEHDERFGVWGGVSERDRRAIAKGKKSVPSFPARQKPMEELMFEEGLKVRPVPARPKFVAPPVRPVKSIDDVVEDYADEKLIEALAEPPKPAKWKVRRMWIAFDPEGEARGPFEEQEDAFAFIGEQLRPLPTPETPVSFPEPVVAPEVQEAVAAAPDAGEKRGYRKWGEADEQAMRDLHADGLSDYAIAKRMERSPALIAKWRAKAGLVANVTSAA